MMEIFVSGMESFLIFFFSSRRRHTRSKRDWSSDVCSSDLQAVDRDDREFALRDKVRIDDRIANRSEERRVGKECRSGWWAYQYRKEELLLLLSIRRPYSAIHLINQSQHHVIYSITCIAY